MKKILTISPDYHPSNGGVEKYLYDIHLILSKTFNFSVYAGTRISDKKNITYKLKNINVIKRRTYKFFGLDFLFNPLDFYSLFLQIKNADRRKLPWRKESPVWLRFSLSSYFIRDALAGITVAGESGDGCIMVAGIDNSSNWSTLSIPGK